MLPPVRGGDRAGVGLVIDSGASTLGFSPVCERLAFLHLKVGERVLTVVGVTSLIQGRLREETSTPRWGMTV